MRARPGPRRTTVAAVALALGACLLTGCGSPTEQYCDRLADSSDRLTRMGQDGTGDLDATLELLEGLRAESPDDLRDEWDTVTFAWQGLAEAFERAGAAPQDFDPADPPAQLAPAEVRAIQDAASVLVSPRVTEAGRAIEQHGQDVCKVDLGL